MEVTETPTGGAVGDQAQITGEIAAGTSPQVSDEETGVEQFVIYVMGAVSRPGPVMSSQGMTVTQILSQSGGVTNDMALKDVRVIRAKPTDGKRVIYVDLDRYLAEGDASLIPKLYPGDMIYVPPITPGGAKDISITITGEVLNSGSYQAREPMDILDAIAMAGGLTPNADPERIRVRRESADSYQEKIVNIDEFLEDVGSTSPTEMVGPGYRIYVPAKRGSVTRVAIVARGVVAFLADLIPIYGLYRLIED
jgi:protein involved in polysaccharide export with SLBB domain